MCTTPFKFLLYLDIFLGGFPSSVLHPPIMNTNPSKLFPRAHGARRGNLCRGELVLVVAEGHGHRRETAVRRGDSLSRWSYEHRRVKGQYKIYQEWILDMHSLFSYYDV